MACAVSSRPRASARSASGSTSLLRPSDAAIAASSAGARPRLDPGRSVKTAADARLPSSLKKPSASLSAASATIATQGPASSGVSARSRSTASRLNGTCAPSSTTGTRRAPAPILNRSIRPGRRAAARVSRSRSAARPARPSARKRPSSEARRGPRPRSARLT